MTLLLIQFLIVKYDVQEDVFLLLLVIKILIYLLHLQSLCQLEIQRYIKNYLLLIVPPHAFAVFRFRLIRLWTL